MKLNEKQAIDLMTKISRHFKLDLEPEDVSEFSMMELINYEIKEVD